MRKIKYRWWSPQGKAFVTDYKYTGLVEELFIPDEYLVPQQWTGLLDKNGKEIYEGDLVNFKTNNTVDLGDGDTMDWEAEEVYWDPYYCSFCFDRRYGHTIYDKIMPETFEVVGNIFETPVPGATLMSRATGKHKALTNILSPELVKHYSAMLSMSLVMGYKRIIKELIETIDNLLIAIELEADYPGERSREEITNAKAIVKELIDLGHK